MEFGQILGKYRTLDDLVVKCLPVYDKDVVLDPTGAMCTLVLMVGRSLHIQCPTTPGHKWKNSEH